MRLQSAELLSKPHLTGALNLFPDSCPHQTMSMSKGSLLLAEEASALSCNVPPEGREDIDQWKNNIVQSVQVFIALSSSKADFVSNLHRLVQSHIVQSLAGGCSSRVE